MTAKKKPAEKPAAAKAFARKTPVTVSGTMSAAARKPSIKEQVNEAHAEIVKAKAATATSIGDVTDGPGLVEHGVGLGRHRPEDGPVAAPGTVVLVTPERG